MGTTGQSAWPPRSSTVSAPTPSSSIYEQNDDDAIISRYVQEYGMVTPENAAKRIEFLRDRRYRSYNFTYRNGYELVNALLTSVDHPLHWYGWLLTEAVTPSQVRRWVAG